VRPDRTRTAKNPDAVPAAPARQRHHEWRKPMVKIHKAADGRLKQDIEVGTHVFHADASVEAGGEGAGPSPHDLLDAALGACTALTVTLVARRKQWPLDDVRVEITHAEAAGVYTLTRKIDLLGALSAEQREYLLGIANKCPIHKALSGRFEIATELQG
jgi:putative redox protein